MIVFLKYKFRPGNRLIGAVQAPLTDMWFVIAAKQSDCLKHGQRRIQMDMCETKSYVLLRNTYGVRYGEVRQLAADAKNTGCFSERGDTRQRNNHEREIW